MECVLDEIFNYILTVDKYFYYLWMVDALR